MYYKEKRIPMDNNFNSQSDNSSDWKANSDRRIKAGLAAKANYLY